MRIINFADLLAVNRRFCGKLSSASRCERRLSGRQAFRTIPAFALGLLLLLAFAHGSSIAQNSDEPNYSRQSVLLALKTIIKKWERIDQNEIAAQFGTKVIAHKQEKFGDLNVAEYRSPESLGFFSLTVNESWNVAVPGNPHKFSIQLNLWKNSLISKKDNPVCITREDVIEAFGSDWIGTLAPLQHGARPVGPFDEKTRFRTYGLEYPLALSQGATKDIARIGFTFGHGNRCLGSVAMPFRRADAAVDDKLRTKN